MATVLAAAFMVACPVAGLLFGQAPLHSEEPTPRPAEDPFPEAYWQEHLPAETAASQTTGQPTDYVIGPEDVLDIEVFNVPELTKTVRVANGGMISLALLGHVRAEGLTTKQLSEQLEEIYGETYLEDPQISVFVKEFHAQPVSVIGAVESPGLYQLTGPRTLIEILSMAGGLAKRSTAAAGRTVTVTRQAGFADVVPVQGLRLLGPDKVEIEIEPLLHSEDTRLNIQVQPRDIVTVSKADIVYVVGAVRKPGGFVLENRETITVMQALARAEGFLGSPAKGSTRIIRETADGSRVEIPVDLGKVLKGKDPDVELAANDILFVPDSTSKVALKRGVEAAIATATGVLIWRR